MTTKSNQVFRITYEAFSKFSTALYKCRTHEEISRCFTLYLKYLFNYHAFRACYSRYDKYVYLESVAGKTTIISSNAPQYLSYEQILLETDIPQRWSDVSSINLPHSFTTIPEEQPELWGWNFIEEERQIIVSVYSGSKKKFTKNDINILKLVADNLQNKLLELCLLRELNKRQITISRIIAHQEGVIKERTSKIENNNKMMLEILELNAHKAREPLARIMGLINLIDNKDAEELIKEIIPLLKISANDLDAALKNVINRATKDLSEYKDEISYEKNNAG